MLENEPSDHLANPSPKIESSLVLPAGVSSLPLKKTVLHINSLQRVTGRSYGINLVILVKFYKDNSPIYFLLTKAQ